MILTVLSFVSSIVLVAFDVLMLRIFFSMFSFRPPDLAIYVFRIFH